MLAYLRHLMPVCFRNWRHSMTSCAFTRGESNSGRESDFGTTPESDMEENEMEIDRGHAVGHDYCSVPEPAALDLSYKSI